MALLIGPSILSSGQAEAAHLVGTAISPSTKISLVYAPENTDVDLKGNFQTNGGARAEETNERERTSSEVK